MFLVGRQGSGHPCDLDTACLGQNLHFCSGSARRVLGPYQKDRREVAAEQVEKGGAGRDGVEAAGDESRGSEAGAPTPRDGKLGLQHARDLGRIGIYVLAHHAPNHTPAHVHPEQQAAEDRAFESGPDAAAQ